MHPDTLNIHLTTETLLKWGRCGAQAPLWPPDLQSRSQMLAVGAETLWLLARSTGQGERVNTRFNWAMQVDSLRCFVVQTLMSYIVNSSSLNNAVFFQQG